MNVNALLVCCCSAVAVYVNKEATSCFDSMHLFKFLLLRSQVVSAAPSSENNILLQIKMSAL